MRAELNDLMRIHDRHLADYEGLYGDDYQFAAYNVLDDPLPRGGRAAAPVAPDRGLHDGSRLDELITAAAAPPQVSDPFDEATSRLMMDLDTGDHSGDFDAATDALMLAMEENPSTGSAPDPLPPALRDHINPVSQWPPYMRDIWALRHPKQMDRLRTILFLFGNGVHPERAHAGMDQHWPKMDNTAHNQIRAIVRRMLMPGNVMSNYFYYDMTRKDTLYLDGRRKPEMPGY
jgi:hypothetical protein